jgi:hypothetical protein
MPKEPVVLETRGYLGLATSQVANLTSQQNWQAATFWLKSWYPEND